MSGLKVTVRCGRDPGGIGPCAERDVAEVFDEASGLVWGSNGEFSLLVAMMNELGSVDA